MPRLYWKPHRINPKVTEAILALTNGIAGEDERIEVVRVLPDVRGIDGMLLLRRGEQTQGAHFKIEVPDEHLFRAKREFTKAGATNRLLNHIHEDRKGIRRVIEDFYQRACDAMNGESDAGADL